MAVNPQDPFNLAGINDFATKNVLLQGAANRIDQTIPGGSLAFSGPGRSTSKITLDPAIQGLFDARVTAAGTGATAAGNILGDLEGGRSAVEKATFDRLWGVADPAYQTIDERRRRELLNRGIPEGDEAFNKAIRLDVTDPRNRAIETARLDAVRAGGEEMARLANVSSGLLGLDPTKGIPDTSSFFAPTAIDTLGPEQLQTQRNMAANNASLAADQIDAQIKSGNLQALTSLGSAAVIGLLANPASGKKLASTIATGAAAAGTSLMGFMTRLFGGNAAEAQAVMGNVASVEAFQAAATGQVATAADPLGVGQIFGGAQLPPTTADPFGVGSTTALDPLAGTIGVDNIIDPAGPGGSGGGAGAGVAVAGAAGIKATVEAAKKLNPAAPFKGLTTQQALNLRVPADSISVLGPELAADVHFAGSFGGATPGLSTASTPADLAAIFSGSGAGAASTATGTGAQAAVNAALASGGTAAALNTIAATAATAGEAAALAAGAGLAEMAGVMASLGPLAPVAAAVSLFHQLSLKEPSTRSTAFTELDRIQANLALAPELGIPIPSDMRAGIDASLLTNTEDDLVGAGTASQRAEQYFNDQLKEEYGTIDPHRALQIKRQRDMLADLNRAAAQGNAEAARLVDANQAAQDREAEARQQAQVDIEALEAQNREREAAVARGEEARRQSMSQADDMIRQIGLTSFEISLYAPTGGQFMAELADKIYRAAIGGDRTAPAKMIQQLREEMEGQGD